MPEIGAVYSVQAPISAQSSELFIGRLAVWFWVWVTTCTVVAVGGCPL